MGLEKRKIALKYIEDDYNEKGTMIEVKYTSKDEVRHEDFKIIRNNLYDYLNNNSSNDIVEITANIKEMLKDFKERELNIIINNEEHYQQVTYLYGKLDFCHLTTYVYDDIVSVKTSSIGTKINYKKHGKYIYDEESIKDINDEINELLNRVYELRKLDNNNVKVKKLK